MDEFEFFADGNDGNDEPLVPHDCNCGGGDTDAVVWDERTVLRRRLEPPQIKPDPPVVLPALKRPCRVAALNGSWYLRFTGRLPRFGELRGPLRIESRGGVLRASKDLYRERVRFTSPKIDPRTPTTQPPPVGKLRLPPHSLVIRRNWYPQLPQSEYVWYARSTGASYQGGVLEVDVERHLWSHAQQEFVSSDRGWLRLTCRSDVLRIPSLPQPTLRMTGQMMVGGQTHQVEAVKTSPYYRGCLVEVDVMENRAWPSSAVHNGATVTFTGVCRSEGFDFRAVVSDTGIPEQNSLSIADLHDLMETHRNLSAGTHGWHLWLFVGSRLGNTNTYGVMFDQQAPHREGAVGFADPILPNSSNIDPAARGRALGTVNSAFLRTLIHEAGHAFNLFHPKHDVHAPPIGREIMNQTGDVLSFASSADPYPGNTLFEFNSHNATSLWGAPDPQVAPGWKPFGWGHGNLWDGIAEPTDAVGFASDVDDESDLTVELHCPDRLVRGEVLIADVEVTNQGESPRAVPAALNLAEDDLIIVVTTPNGERLSLHDVVLACGPRRIADLDPGQALSGALQLFYTNRGFVFDQPGRYRLHAELDAGDGSDAVLVSAACEVEVDLPVKDEDRELAELSMNEEVGRAIALGDVTTHDEAAERMHELMDRFIERDTGAICALVLANSHARPSINVLTGDVVQEAHGNRARGALDRVLKERKAAEVMRLAVAAASPAEPDAPVLDAVMNRLQRGSGSTYNAGDIEAAEHLLDGLRTDRPAPAAT